MIEIKRLPLYIVCALLLGACANMGTPDGGEYDEQPPKLLRTSPQVNAVNWTGRTIDLYFDEYVKVENAAEKVIVSPPQIEPPEITSLPTKHISIKLQEDLLPNATYTIDFSDAIVDNNESNPFGSYAFTFSTGAEVDTFEVSGHVLAADNLDPIKGIYVGAYLMEGDTLPSDTIFRTQPLERVSRTDERGYFRIRGLKGNVRYHVVALLDGDQNFVFNQKSEQIAFFDSLITTTAAPDLRPDTVWRDTITIDSIRHIPYTHYRPDNLILQAFKEDASTLYLLKAERLEANQFSIYFSSPSPQLPVLKGLNFDAEDAFIVEKSLHNDTLTYHLRDTLLCQIDTLHLAMEYYATDTLGVLSLTGDTLELPIKRRVAANYNPNSDTKKKKGEEDTPPPPPTLSVQITPAARMEIQDNLVFTFPEPITGLPDSLIRLEEQAPKDTLFKPKPFLLQADTLNPRRFTLRAEWNPGYTYTLHVDSAAVQSIYGTRTKAIDHKATMKTTDEYASLIFRLTGLQDSAAFVELLNESGKLVHTATVTANTAEFYFVKPGKYYARLIADRNNNGKWDTGLYPITQPEQVFYFDKLLELRALWDSEEDWNITSLPIDRQKPDKLKPQTTTKKQRESRNATRRSR